MILYIYKYYSYQKIQSVINVRYVHRPQCLKFILFNIKIKQYYSVNYI